MGTKLFVFNGLLYLNAKANTANSFPLHKNKEGGGGNNCIEQYPSKPRENFVSSTARVSNVVIVFLTNADLVFTVNSQRHS